MNSRQLNLVLGAVVAGLLGTIYFLMSWAKEGQRVEVIDRTNYLGNTVTQITVKKFNATNLLAALADRTLGWSAIESTNYLIYMRNLRSIACPEETIRDIIFADVAKLYAKKETAILEQAPPYEFWRTGPLAEQVVDDASWADLRRLDQEKRQLIRDLLGVDFDTELAKYRADPAPLDKLRGVFGEETRRQIRDIVAAYDRAEAEIRARGGGYMLPEEEAELRDLHLRRLEELSQILTPEQLGTFELYMSPLAEEMRQELYGFEPSPEEFVEVFNLRKSFEAALDATLNQVQGLDPLIQEQVLAAAEESLANEIRAKLGDDRYAQYAQAMDPDYQQLLRLDARLPMAEGTLERIYSMKNTAQRQKNNILANPNLSPDQRQRAVEAIVTATQSALSELMGDQLLAAYQQGGAEWLQELGEVPAGSTEPAPVAADVPPLPTLPEPTGPQVGDMVPPDAPFPFYQPPIVPPPPPLPNPVPQ